MISKMNRVKKYLNSCQTEFWQKVFEAESDYLVHALEGVQDVLSVGCGTAVIENTLSERGFCVIGLDISQEALGYASNSVRTVVARAEDMPFENSSFDAAIYIASLQFIQDYKKAIENTADVLRPNGRLVVMLINPESAFFKGKFRDPDSYVRKIKHINIHQMEATIAERFYVEAEYFLGIENQNLFESRNPYDAALYVIKGIKKP